jgi:hypothetical protein
VDKNLCGFQESKRCVQQPIETPTRRFFEHYRGGAEIPKLFDKNPRVLSACVKIPNHTETDGIQPLAQTKIKSKDGKYGAKQETAFDKTSRDKCGYGRAMSKANS